MFNTTIFDGLPDASERALEEDDLQWRVAREEVRLVRAILASSDPNERWHEARRMLRGRRYRNVDELIADLNRPLTGVPFVLRALGSRPIPSRAVREHVAEFFRDLVGNPARLRAGVAPPGEVAGHVSARAMTDEVYSGVERAMRLIGHWGPGYRQAAYVLTGRILELAGLTARRVSPNDDIDLARIEAVRRARRRIRSYNDAAGVIIITTFGDERDT